MRLVNAPRTSAARTAILRSASSSSNPPRLILAFALRKYLRIDFGKRFFAIIHIPSFISIGEIRHPGSDIPTFRLAFSGPPHLLSRDEPRVRIEPRPDERDTPERPTLEARRRSSAYICRSSVGERGTFRAPFDYLFRESQSGDDVLAWEGRDVGVRNLQSE